MQHPRHKVAVIDDDDAVRDSLRFLLETAGFSVSIFSSADNFLAEWEPDEETHLLIDLHMPRVSGFELMRRLHARGRKVSAALMTDAPQPELTRRAAQLGMIEVMEKPLDYDVLMRFITHEIT